MVNRVVPRTDLEAEVQALGEKIATAEPFALKILKRSLNRALDMQGLRTSLEAHFDTHQLSHVSEEFKAVRDKGLSAAIQKGARS